MSYYEIFYSYSDTLFHSILRHCIIVVAWHSLYFFFFKWFRLNEILQLGLHSPPRNSFVSARLYPISLCTAIIEMSSNSMRIEFSALWMRDFLHLPCFVCIEFSNLITFLVSKDSRWFLQPKIRSSWMAKLSPEFPSIYEISLTPIKILFSVREYSWMHDILRFPIRFLVIWKECSNERNIQSRFSFFTRLSRCGRFDINVYLYRGLINCRFEWIVFSYFQSCAS